MNHDFETISELSKIRKFIFSEVKSHSAILPGLLEAFGSYWIEMENNFLNIGDISLFEQFISDFLTIQNNGIIPKKNELFNDFTGYFKKASKFQKKELVLRNIYRYSVYFIKIMSGSVNDDEIKSKIDEINSHNAKDAYPFLMEVFEDYDYAHINKNMLLDILDTVIGFIHERNSHEPSRLAVSFAGLSGEINKMMILKDYMPRFILTDNIEQEERLSETSYT